MGRHQDGASTANKASREQEYEFMGPWIGPLGIMLGLPGVCYALVYTCNAGGEQFSVCKPTGCMPPKCSELDSFSVKHLCSPCQS